MTVLSCGLLLAAHGCKGRKLTKRLETAVEFEFLLSLDSGPYVHGALRCLNRTAVEFIACKSPSHLR